MPPHPRPENLALTLTCWGQLLTLDDICSSWPMAAWQRDQPYPAFRAWVSVLIGKAMRDQKLIAFAIDGGNPTGRRRDQLAYQTVRQPAVPTPVMVDEIVDWTPELDAQLKADRAAEHAAEHARNRAQRLLADLDRDALAADDPDARQQASAAIEAVDEYRRAYNATPLGRAERECAAAYLPLDSEGEPRSNSLESGQ